MSKDWSELTPQERQAERFKRWLSPSIKFSSPEAAEAYKARATRFIKAINLEEADRVPVWLPEGFFPAFYVGGNLQRVMYDYEEMRRAWLKFMEDFEMDAYDAPLLVLPGRAMELAGVRMMAWPGHGLPVDNPTYQYIEGEYMKVEEYDRLLQDPSDFWLRTFLPRIVGELEPLQTLPQLTPMVGIPVFYFIQYGRPEIQKALQALMEAGEEAMKWMGVVAECRKVILEAGYPSMWGGISQAPFDMIGDMLRGTHGVMLDMYRRPEKLIEAMESLVPIAINEAVTAADASGGPIVVIPLHKGDDTFMSDKQYEKFYWPTFRKLLMGLINEGVVPMMFAEGKYNRRLEVIKDLPRGSAIWWFDRTDMAGAKEVLGNHACIAGNVPNRLLYTSTPQAVKEYCRQLIQDCAEGGGYILTVGASMNKGNPDNLRAMMTAAKEYGVYKK